VPVDRVDGRSIASEDFAQIGASGGLGITLDAGMVATSSPAVMLRSRTS